MGHGAPWGKPWPYRVIADPPMHTTPVPEIDPSELKAVRQFLTSVRDEQRDERRPGGPHLPRVVPLRNGIARVRSRAEARTDG